MRGLFDNILYLIPIALFIAFRIIGAKNKQSGKPPQKRPSTKQADGGLGELVKKIQEAQKNPDYNGGRMEARELYIPSVTSQKTVSKKPAAAKKPEKKPASTPVSKNVEKIVPLQSSIKSDEETQTVPAAQKTAPLQNLQVGIAGLSPLQQAVVWSEILGQPKGIL